MYEQELHFNAEKRAGMPRQFAQPVERRKIMGNGQTQSPVHDSGTSHGVPVVHGGIPPVLQNQKQVTGGMKMKKRTMLLCVSSLGRGIAISHRSLKEKISRVVPKGIKPAYLYVSARFIQSRRYLGNNFFAFITSKT